MARRGDGIYLRGKTWWLDFTHEGRRYVARLSWPSLAAAKRVVSKALA